MKFSFLLVGIALMATFIDWLQTVYIARHPERFYERNPFLGTHPTVRFVCLYFATMTGAGLVAAVGLHQLDHDAVLGICAFLVLVIEAGCVLNNKNLGIGLGWEP